MKKICYLIGAGTMLLLAAACSSDDVSETPKKETTGEIVRLTANIDDENNSEAKTRATLSESNGAFAFSQHDEIKVFDGTKTYEGRTTTAGNNNVEIEMAAGFTLTGSGYAGFPASMVSSISSSGVTFVLPTNYTYAEVGGADPDASKVPCPMVATYNSESANLVFKQVGAVVRFRVTNCAAGSLTFTFPTNVTGTTAAIATPKTAGEGGIEGFASGAANSITVTGVPAVASNSYIYITLPVINGTAPQNILVTNTPDDASALRIASLTGTETALSRAGGFKIGAALENVSTTTEFQVSSTGTKVVLAPGNLMAQIGSFNSTNNTATASEWKFGGPFDFIGSNTTGGNYLFFSKNANCVGKWVDFFVWQGTSCATDKRVHGLYAGDDKSYNGNGHPESLYDGCWNGLTISNGGSYAWRPMTNAEANYLLSGRTTSTLNGVPNARFARAVVAGTNGLLIFPDNVGSVWNTETMGHLPYADYINNIGEIGTYADWSTIATNNSYTATQIVAMLNAGIVFLPAAGVWRNSGSGSGPTFGRYWTSTSSSNINAYGFGFGTDNVESSYTLVRNYGRSVRLVREVTVTP